MGSSGEQNSLCTFTSVLWPFTLKSVLLYRGNVYIGYAFPMLKTFFLNDFIVNSPYLNDLICNSLPVPAGPICTAPTCSHADSKPPQPRGKPSPGLVRLSMSENAGGAET